MAEKQRCSKHVYRDRDVRGSPCATPATVLEDGKWWCKRHAKVGRARRKAKQDERTRQYIEVMESDIALDQEKQRRYDLFPQLLEALEDIHRQADGWCCLDDSGNPTLRFEDIALEASAAIELAHKPGK